MKPSTFIISVAVVACLGGCATSGNEHLKDQTSSTIHDSIFEGVSTKDSIRASMGEATTVTFTDGGNEVWTYHYARSVPQLHSFIPYVNLVSSVADVKSKELVVMFDKNNVVAKYVMREVSSVKKVGLAY
ncbi:MAG: hypothetical protein WCH44_04450 [Betaproteobacteria bacterium]